MARKLSPSIRTTLYRLVELADLATAIKPKYLTRDEFSQNFVTVGEREALLVHGTMVTDIVSWASTAHGLTGCPIELGNQTAAAVLLIRNGDGAWALTYGMGFQLLDYNKLDPGFGQRVAIRTADANALNSLTRTTIDHRSRTDRFSIPSGEHLWGFGVGDFGAGRAGHADVTCQPRRVASDAGHGRRPAAAGVVRPRPRLAVRRPRSGAWPPARCSARSSGREVAQRARFSPKGGD